MFDSGELKKENICAIHCHYSSNAHLTYQNANVGPSRPIICLFRDVILE